MNPAPIGAGRPRRPALSRLAVPGMVALSSLVLLTSGGPAQGATGLERRLARDGWGAERIGRTFIPAADQAALDRLPASARVAWHPGTLHVRFLAGTPRAPLAAAPAGSAQKGAAITPAAAERSARRFLRTYGPLFGVDHPDRDLRLVRGPASTPDRGPRPGPTVRLRQVRDTIPVLGGELVVQLGPGGEVIAASGELLPSDDPAPTRPRLPARTAQDIARTWLAREVGLPADRVVASREGLAIHDGRLMGGPDSFGPRLVWRIDAAVRRAAGGMPEHRLVLVDALHGHVVAAIRRDADLDRRICDFANRPSSDPTCREPYRRREGQPQTGIVDVDEAYRNMGAVDAWYRTRFGRDGFDDAGAPMVASVRYCSSWGCPMRNALWRWPSEQVVFGRGWATDDVVGHEFTHGVIEHEARLFYLYQSGAINESLADVFGELIDLANPAGRDTAGSRWKIGEDLPTGALRDMRDPTRFRHPDRVRSPLWHTSPADDGGVHRNSGVGNKAASLIADGGTFNGEVVRPIGLERTALIFYRALTAKLTPASDYLDLGDALLQSCLELAGSMGISTADCASVRAATRATQMHLRAPGAPSPAAPVCGDGKVAIDTFFDDMEDPERRAWRPARLAGDRKVWYFPPNPNNDPTWDARWSTSGELNLYAADHRRRTDGTMTLRTPLSVPVGARLRFAHAHAFDAGDAAHDGGVVEVSIDGGPWRALRAEFTHVGYNGRIAKGTGNPLAGRKAFVRRSRGYTASRADLSAFAGRELRLRFRAASDRSGSAEGWYIDDVRIYRCVPDEGPPTGSLTIDGGAASTTDAQVDLHIDATDGTGGLARMLVSNSDAMDGGRLAQALALDPSPQLGWSLSDPAWGGTAAPGTKHVYVQVRDAAGHWSAVLSDEIELIGEP